MAIIPLQLARVSNALTMGLAQRSISRTQQSLLDVQNQLTSGKRINVPSDDPVGASAAAQLRRVLELNQGYATNLQNASSQLSSVDTALGDLTDQIQEAYNIAQANVGDTVTADARTAAAAMVDSIYNQVLNLSNQQFQGMYIFGGQRADQQPFVTDLGGIRFNGSDTVLQNTFEAGTNLPFMVNGNQVFGALSGRVKGSVDLTPSLTPGTRLADLRGATGQGVQGGSIVLSDGTTSKVVDLSHADTIQDVVNAINAAAVGGIAASISPGGTGLRLSAGAADNITVTEAGGTTAAELGILTPTGGGVGVNVTGQTLSPQVTPLTNLADLRNGSGIDTAGGLVITNGAKTATVSLAGVTTVEGLINAINGSGAGTLARINADGTGIDVLNCVQGTSLTISENGGTTAADLGIRSLTPQTALSELNGGQGVRTTANGADIQITRRNGTSFQVDLSNLNTIQDVISAINAADGGGGLTASFATSGNGIVLTDSTGGGGPLRVENLNFSKAAADLGIAGTAPAAVLTGKDVNGVEANGIFANLAKLRDALIHNDTSAITSAAEAIKADQDRVVLMRGQVGAAVKDFESRQQRLDDQNVATKSLLSSIEDVDYNEAVTKFQTLQTALQANLQTTGKLLNLSLLDFLG